MTNNIFITIVNYPNALKSAVYGLQELFISANAILKNQALDARFYVDICTPKQLNMAENSHIDLIIVPPIINGDYHLSPAPELINFLIQAQRKGVILCSACAGAFILAETGLFEGKMLTTHWQMANDFREKYPKVHLNTDKILINSINAISAGGLMSWIDLGLEIVARFSKPFIMRLLGKFLIVDTGKREQRYYESFNPSFAHNNDKIVKVQHYIQDNYQTRITMKDLSSVAFITERTLLRQFTQATDWKPLQYIQRIRVQKACEALESTTQSLEQIAALVGYNDVNSFRKVFNKVIGLSPTEFRQRFR
ncbi:MAG: transcriptional regulator GlxA family with amidase domain [Oceanospirillaceae bacterium]|jgi:transcriptional regulator GlxA family with amidase domain